MPFVWILSAGTMPVRAQGAVFYVSTQGNNNNDGSQAHPWRTIQKACNTASPGATVNILAGTYNEKVIVNVSGNASAGFITLRNYQSDVVIVDGTGKSGSNMFEIVDQSYFRLQGLEIVNNRNVNFGAGVYLEGASHHIEIRNCRIHEIRGTEAQGIGVYGTNATTSISDLILDGNEIYDCDPAQSEALTLNGNVELFQVTNNQVHDVNNIGIDFIAGEGTCPDPAKDAARNGVCRGNVVRRARSNYGGGFAGAIYVDGGRDIIIERNIVTESDIGIEVGAENPGVIATNVIVKNNLIYNNDKIGLAFGGYDVNRGRVRNCKFFNNTFYRNNVLTGSVQNDASRAEIFIQYAENNQVENNIIYGSTNNRILLGTAVAQTNTQNNLIDYNLWFVDADVSQARFYWNDTFYTGLTAYRASSPNDVHSLGVNPSFVNPNLATPDLHLSGASLAFNAGATLPEVLNDFDNVSRPQYSFFDIGAFEIAEFLLIQNFYPLASTSGKTILVTGSGFVPGDTQVFFGGSRRIPATVLSVTATNIQVQVPPSTNGTGNINGFLTVRAAGNEATSQNLPVNASNPADPNSTFPEFVLLGDANADGLFQTNDITLARAFLLFQVAPTARQSLSVDVIPANANGSRGNGQLTTTDFTFLRAVSFGQTTF
ncbi:MAG: right-handed parallel beta-helix repeat-containing protein [Blastocatellia bacterium]|nr:right-handed parallel beta-helix repeat-containing protein [Blastocatellia bacterium]